MIQWWVEFGGGHKKSVVSREAGKDYMRSLVHEANIWELQAGQLKTEVDFEDMPDGLTVIKLNKVVSGKIYEVRT